MTATLTVPATTDSFEQRLGNLPPNWFASVMATGIVANAGITLPVGHGVLRGPATVIWLVAAGWLTVLTVASVRQWIQRPQHARRWIADPVVAHFYGAPPMAMLTVGAGTLLFGKGILGEQTALWIGVLLWIAGTLTGLVSTVVVPMRVILTHDLELGQTFAGWLMPVVPPMVSAATGALLIPQLPAGQAQETMLFACYAMFGISLIASITIITLVWFSLVRVGPGPAKLVPTLFIVLGPLGQSVTAANQLGGLATHVLPAPYGEAFSAFAVLYGVPVWGFAMMWLVLAAMIVRRTMARGLPFSMTWWSFTFPVGTCVTGTSGLALHTGLVAFEIAAVLLYLLLVGAWLVVGARTVRGLVRDTLFR
jgi:C4-dicarboxylate transporter/malic acid transport protein